MQATCAACHEPILLVGRVWVTRPGWAPACPANDGGHHRPKGMSHT